MSTSFPGAPAGADTASLAAALIKKWALLEPLAIAGWRRASPPSLALADDELDQVSAWANVFKQEIETIRHTRNFVTHLGPAAVSVSQLVDANDFSERLLQLLVAKVPRLSEALGIHLPSTPWWDVPRQETA